MTFEDTFVEEEVRSTEGQTLIRRFTGELNGQTTLEVATITVQKKQDALVEERHTNRMRALYQDQHTISSELNFSEAAHARIALQKICREFQTDENTSTLSSFGIRRKSARVAANEAMQQLTAQNFSELYDFVNSHETRWKGNLSKVGSRFRKLCGTLEAHSKAFALFPSQNEYTSVLSGGLALIVGAAANHDEIAETLSATVADIAVEASRASDILEVFNTQVMRELLSDVYAQVFLFYRDTIEWYMKSKTSRFFSSFNEKLKERYDNAAARIDISIQRMYRQGNIANWAMLAVANSTPRQLHDDAIRRRQQGADDVTLAIAGRRMQDFIASSYNAWCNEGSMIDRDPVQQALPPRCGSVSSTTGLLNRAKVRARNSLLEEFIIGNEGHSVFKDGRLWLPHLDVSSKLHDWMNEDTRSPTLWIYSPAVSNGMPSSRAAATTSLFAAWRSGIPTISHFCERPRFADVPDERNAEKIGIIGLIYSLIIQLLQFDFDEDAFEIAEEQIKRLDGSDESWPHALDLFARLLETTPQLSLCIVDGLNDLAFSAGAKWCDDFLSSLFSHQTSCTGIFRVLITTSGQSRVLPNHIALDSRVFIEKEAQQVIRGGQWVDASEK